jgi:hypothetical protein
VLGKQWVHTKARDDNEEEEGQCENEERGIYI